MSELLSLIVSRKYSDFFSNSLFYWVYVYEDRTTKVKISNHRIRVSAITEFRTGMRREIDLDKLTYIDKYCNEHNIKGDIVLNLSTYEIYKWSNPTDGVQREIFTTPGFWYNYSKLITYDDPTLILELLSNNSTDSHIIPNKNYNFLNIHQRQEFGIFSQFEEYDWYYLSSEKNWYKRTYTNSNNVQQFGTELLTDQYIINELDNLLIILPELLGSSEIAIGYGNRIIYFWGSKQETPQNIKSPINKNDLDGIWILLVNDTGVTSPIDFININTYNALNTFDTTYINNYHYYISHPNFNKYYIGFNQETNKREVYIRTFKQSTNQISYDRILEKNKLESSEIKSILSIVNSYQIFNTDEFVNSGIDIIVSNNSNLIAYWSHPTVSIINNNNNKIISTSNNWVILKNIIFPKRYVSDLLSFDQLNTFDIFYNNDKYNWLWVGNNNKLYLRDIHYDSDNINKIWIVKELKINSTVFDNVIAKYNERLLDIINVDSDKCNKLSVWEEHLISNDFLYYHDLNNSNYPDSNVYIWAHVVKLDNGKYYSKTRVRLSYDPLYWSCIRNKSYELILQEVDKIATKHKITGDIVVDTRDYNKIFIWSYQTQSYRQSLNMPDNAGWYPLEKAYYFLNRGNKYVLVGSPEINKIKPNMDIAISTEFDAIYIWSETTSSTEDNSIGVWKLVQDNDIDNSGIFSRYLYDMDYTWYYYNQNEKEFKISIRAYDENGMGWTIKIDENGKNCLNELEQTAILNKINPYLNIIMIDGTLEFVINNKTNDMLYWNGDTPTTKFVSEFAIGTGRWKSIKTLRFDKKQEIIISDIYKQFIFDLNYNVYWINPTSNSFSLYRRYFNKSINSWDIALNEEIPVTIFNVYKNIYDKYKINGDVAIHKQFKSYIFIWKPIINVPTFKDDPIGNWVAFSFNHETVPIKENDDDFVDETLDPIDYTNPLPINSAVGFAATGLQNYTIPTNPTIIANYLKENLDTEIGNGKTTIRQLLSDTYLKRRIYSSVSTLSSNNSRENGILSRIFHSDLKNYEVGKGWYPYINTPFRYLVFSNGNYCDTYSGICFDTNGNPSKNCPDIDWLDLDNSLNQLDDYKWIHTIENHDPCSLNPITFGYFPKETINLPSNKNIINYDNKFNWDEWYESKYTNIPIECETFQVIEHDNTLIDILDDGFLVEYNCNASNRIFKLPILPLENINFDNSIIFKYQFMLNIYDYVFEIFEVTKNKKKYFNVNINITNDNNIYSLELNTKRFDNRLVSYFNNMKFNKPDSSNIAIYNQTGYVLMTLPYNDIKYCWVPVLENVNIMSCKKYA